MMPFSAFSELKQYNVDLNSYKFALIENGFLKWDVGYYHITIVLFSAAESSVRSSHFVVTVFDILIL